MSTNLKPVTSAINELKLTRFFGGQSNGVCLQISQRDGRGNWGYIQLNKKDMRRLAKRFKTFDKEKENHDA